MDPPSKAQAQRPIVQSYMVPPSFAHYNSAITNKNSGGSVRVGTSYTPRHVQPNIRPKTYFPKRTNYYPNHNIHNMYSKRPDTSSKKWVRPVAVLGAINAVSISTEPVISKSLSESNSDNGSNNDNIPVAAPVKVVPQPVVISNLSSEISSKNRVQLNPPPATSSLYVGPLKPIVRLNKKFRFRLVGSTGSNNKIEVVGKIKNPSCCERSRESDLPMSVNSNNRSKYKLDRRTLTNKPKQLGMEIARNTLISGLTLAQRRSSLAYFTQASLQSRLFIKGNAYAKRNLSKSFIVKQYSLKRIRKYSLRLSNKWQSQKSQSDKYKLSNKRGDNSNLESNGAISSQHSQLELSSLSMTQNSTVRRASRVIQRSRQRLSASKRKINTFCMFYNRFGVCKRQEDGKCQFVHDPRQIQVCNRFLNDGSCKVTDCKLSHCLTKGKIPSCKFFNEGVCSKENCQYRHVLFSPRTKKMRQRKLTETGKSDNPTSSKKLKFDSKSIEKPEENKARYFEISPNSQPILAIIPRRYPKGVETSPQNYCVEESSKDESSVICESDESDDSKNESSVSDESFKSDISEPLADATGVSNKRQRLLDRVKKLKSNPKEDKTSSTSAPVFLKFT